MNYFKCGTNEIEERNIGATYFVYDGYKAQICEGCESQELSTTEVRVSQL